tara:strand:+ start:296 stop:526 length:231 start_codon:yes stop_codon:yes gene_type:complete
MSIFKNFFIKLIKLYQFTISPLIGTNCRFVPSCSNYAIQSIEEKGVVKGIYFSLRRVLKCHPFGGSGYDPVNKNKY